MSVSPAYSLDSEYMLCQQTRAFPVWSQVCCIFLSHSSSVHTADLWFHFINIQTCCSDQENKHTVSLSPPAFSPFFLLLQGILKKWHTVSPTELLHIFNGKCIYMVIHWLMHSNVIEHDPGIKIKIIRQDSCLWRACKVFCLGRTNVVARKWGGLGMELNIFFKALRIKKMKLFSKAGGNSSISIEKIFDFFF